MQNIKKKINQGLEIPLCISLNNFSHAVSIKQKQKIFVIFIHFTKQTTD